MVERPRQISHMHSAIFPFLSVAEEESLLARASEKRFNLDAIVVDQNVENRSIYVIRRGSVVVECEHRGGWLPIAELGPEQFFGEMSFVDGERTSARVVCNAPATITVISSEDIDALERQYRGVTERVYRSIAAILARRVRLSLGNRRLPAIRIDA
jgi:CRP-like cAMP-binding protein